VTGIPGRAGIGRTALRGVAAAVLVGVFALSCLYLAAVVFGGRGGDRAAILPLPVTPELIARGAYLAKAGDCTGCHTTPGGAAFAGGLAIDSPIGVIFSTNITPDPKTGIGGYAYGDFDRAVRRGLLRSGRTLYPAMPYPSYSRITDGDLAALYAYFLHGVAPVSSRNRAEQVAWPLSMRWPLTYWRWLFAPRVRAFRPRAGQDPVVARGAYLVEGLGHCGACHTPRALTLEEVALTDGGGPRFLAGSQFNGWFAPSLRGAAVTGLGRWAGADIEEFLASGRTGKFTAFGEMGDVVLHSTQFMTPADRAGIANFLHTLPAPRSERAIAAGSQGYLDNCSACHQEDGAGLATGFPALAGNPVVETDDPTSLIHVVLAGGALVSTPAAPSKLTMPPFAASLTDSDIADLLTYVRSSWGNHAPAVSADRVRALRAAIGEPEPPAQAQPGAAPEKH